MFEELEEKLEDTLTAKKSAEDLKDQILSENLRIQCAHDGMHYKFKKYQSAYYESTAVLKNYRKVIENYEQYNCENCHASFSSSEGLESHKLLHTSTFDVPTEEMNFLANKHSELIMECQSLREELRLKEKIIKEKKLSCTKCDASFASHSSLLIHQYWHISGMRCPEIGIMQLEVDHSRLKEDYRILQEKCEVLEGKNKLSQSKVIY